MAEFRGGGKNDHTVYLQRGKGPDTRPEPDGDKFWLVVIDPAKRDMVVELLNLGLDRVESWQTPAARAAAHPEIIEIIEQDGTKGHDQ